MAVGVGLRCGDIPYRQRIANGPILFGERKKLEGTAMSESRQYTSWISKANTFLTQKSTFWNTQISNQPLVDKIKSQSKHVFDPKLISKQTLFDKIKSQNKHFLDKQV